jgi:hypothetical protein
MQVFFIVGLLACASFSTAAQTAPPSRPSPLDASSAVAPLTYRSPLADYRRTASDPAPLAWRDANDLVERIGGWRAYAREAQAAPPPAPAASAPAPAAPASAPRATRPATPPPGHRH